MGDNFVEQYHKQFQALEGKKYSPDQPRVPKGESTGGQWARAGTGGSGQGTGDRQVTGRDGTVHDLYVAPWKGVSDIRMGGPMQTSEIFNRTTGSSVWAGIRNAPSGNIQALVRLLRGGPWVGMGEAGSEENAKERAILAIERYYKTGEAY